MSAAKCTPPSVETEQLQLTADEMNGNQTTKILVKVLENCESRVLASADIERIIAALRFVLDQPRQPTDTTIIIRILEHVSAKIFELKLKLSRLDFDSIDYCPLVRFCETTRTF